MTTLLLNHLKQKPEARDLLQELMTNIHAGSSNQKNTIVPESRGPNL